MRLDLWLMPLVLICRPAPSNVDWQHVFERLVWGGAGALVSLSVAYVVVGKDLAYLKGAMKQVMEVVAEWYPLKEKTAAMSVELTVIKDDVRNLKVIAHHQNGAEIPPYETN